MNTKQIWHALSTNPITDSDFDGVFSSDLLEDIVVKPKLIICNTDPSYKEGKHWVLFYFDKSTVEFYDSLGKSIKDYNSFVKFGKKYAIDFMESNCRTQPKNTAICGELCLYYSYYRCNGYNMEFILNKMQNVNEVVEFVNKKFNICYDSKCKLLQYGVLL